MTKRSPDAQRIPELEDIDRYLLSGVCPAHRWERANAELEALVCQRINAEWLANRAVAREATLRKERRRLIRLVCWWVAFCVGMAVLSGYLWSIGE